MAVRKKYRNALGRGLDDIGKGLDALIDTSGVSTQGSSNIGEIDIDLIEPNPDQPRRTMDTASMEELAASIREMGLVQPITVRKSGDGRYQIIAGERRWKACRMAGSRTVPAYIRTVEDENVMEMALVENIQREDLNPIEIALAYEHLLEKSGLTQEKMSKRVGKSRASVTNYLRLLKLPAEIQMALKDKVIDMGHARTLLSLDSPSQQIRLFKELKKGTYSVRKVEMMVSMLKNGQTVQTAKKKVMAENKLPDALLGMRDTLSALFHSDVKMTRLKKGGGRITIPFNNNDELEKIMTLFSRIHPGDDD